VVGEQTDAEFRRLKAGERVLLTWSGYDRYADAIRDVRPAAVNKFEERFTFPAEFVSFDTARRYPGIDVVYYGNGRQLEFDFLVAPGADPGAIRMCFEGTQQPALEPNGELILQAEAGEEVLRLGKPGVYQLVNGKRRDVRTERRLHHGRGISRDGPFGRHTSTTFLWIPEMTLNGMSRRIPAFS
jgi:hypothetical protein